MRDGRSRRGRRQDYTHKLTGRILLGPLAADALRVLLALLVMLRDVGRERVVGVRRGEEGLDREEDGADLQGGRPLVWKGVASVI